MGNLLTFVAFTMLCVSKHFLIFIYGNNNKIGKSLLLAVSLEAITINFTKLFTQVEVHYSMCSMIHVSNKRASLSAVLNENKRISGIIK